MQNQNHSSLISSIYKARKTVLELMDRQGFNVSDYNNFSINEVNSMKQNNQLDMLLEKKQEDTTYLKPKRKMYIRFYLTKMIRPANIQEMIDDLFNLEEILTREDTLFIIVKDEMNETIINELKHIWEQDGIFIIVENIKRLQYNILNHTLVPPHEIINDKEVDEIMKKYNIKNKIEFPEISRFDPVARAIGLRPGDVCKIIRPSKTSITTNYYRVCI